MTTTAVDAVKARHVPWARLVIGVAFAAVVLYLPQYYKAFEVRRLTTVIVYAIAILGLNLLTGFNGQISLGHGAFYGVGAYTTVILVADHGWPHLATVPIAAAVTFAVGLLAGVPALRIRGLYLALTTLALATVFPTLVQHYRSFTGGTQGKAVEPYVSPISSIANDQWGYYVALAFAVVLFLLVRNLVHSRVGRALVAVRDNEVAAEVVGVNLARYKVLTFGVSAMIAGIAGSLSVFLLKDFGYTAARDFTIALSISFLVGMVIGGAASIVGPIIGALFIERAPTFITDTLKLNGSLTNVAYGVILIALMLLMPGGVVGLWYRIRAVVLRRMGRSGGGQAPAAAFASAEGVASAAAEAAPEPEPSDPSAGPSSTA